MATITSAATGNFSAPATWVGGVVPGPLDNARAAAGHNITIDVNTTVIDIQSVTTGRFIMGEGVTLTANVIAPTSVNTTLLVPVSTSCTIIGNMNALTTAGSVICEKTGTGVLNIFGIVSGGSSTNMRGLLISNTGTVNVTGDVIAPTLAGVNNANAIIINASSTLNILGNVYCSATPSGSSLSAAIISTVSVISVNITGTVRGGSQSAVVLSGADAVLNITGDVLAPIGTANNGSVTSSGINSTTTITGNIYAGLYGTSVNITGTNSLLNIEGGVYAHNSNLAPAVIHGSTTIGKGTILKGSLFYGALGAIPIRTNMLRVVPDDNDVTVYTINGGGTQTRATLTNIDYNVPLASDVRQGVVYGNSIFTGTLIVPSPSNVRKGVPTDATIGTADLTAQDFLDLLSTSPDPIAERLRNVATVQTTGDQITSLS